MKKSDVACLALRIVGIYLFATYLSFATMWFVQRGEQGLLMPLASFLLTIAPGIILLVFSDKLSRRVLPNADDPFPSAPLSISDWQCIAFSSIGVLMVAQAFPQVVRSITTFLPLPRYGSILWARVTAPALKLILGVVLFLQSRGLAKLWKILQSGRPMRKESS